MAKKVTLTIERLEKDKDGVTDGRAWTRYKVRVKEWQKNVAYVTFQNLTPYIGKTTDFAANYKRNGEWTNYTIIGVAKETKDVGKSGWLELQDVYDVIIDLKKRVEALEEYTGILKQ